MMSSAPVTIGSLVAVLLLSASDVVALRGIRPYRTACASLIDHSTFYSVKIKVAHREFEVIPDTGSNSIIIPSCKCFEQKLGCPRGDACIKKTNDNQPEIREQFGSGSIFGFKQSEVVTIGDEGKAAAKMGGVLLMTDRRELDIDGAFEGILGLGVPKAFSKADDKLGLTEFLLDSKVKRFQLCFGNSQGGEQSGNLVFNGQPAPGEKFVPNIGSTHWSAELRGIAVGDSTAEAVTCRPEDMLADQAMPCAAIPDSGTTMILGSTDGIEALTRSICHRWPLCRRKARHLDSTEHAFEELLMRCDAIDFEDMPPLQLRLGAGNDKETMITLPSSAYVLRLPGNKCELAFEAFDYNTVETGAVWILGQALFLQYQVIFEPRGNRIGFSGAPCSSCGTMNSSEVGGGGAEVPGQNELWRMPLASSRPRLSMGKKRTPHFNTSLPL